MLIVVLNVIVLELPGAMMDISSVDRLLIPMSAAVLVSVLELERIVLVYDSAAFEVDFTVDTVDGMLDNSVLVLCAAELYAVVMSIVFVVSVLVWAAFVLRGVASSLVKLREAEDVWKARVLFSAGVSEVEIIDNNSELLLLLVPEATVLVLCVGGMVFVVTPAV